MLPVMKQALAPMLGVGAHFIGTGNRSPLDWSTSIPMTDFTRSLIY